MIGEPKFWYGGMLQQAAAGRFLGYGGMRQTGVGDFTYTFTHHARARRGLDFGDEHRNRCLGHRLAFLRRQKVARHDKRFRMQLPVNLSWVGGPHIKTLVGVSLGSARGMHVYAPRPFASVTHTIYGRWPSGVRGYALSGGHQTVHSVWGYACRAFRSPNHTLTPTYSKSWVSTQIRWESGCGAKKTTFTFTHAALPVCVSRLPPVSFFRYR